MTVQWMRGEVIRHRTEMRLLRARVQYLVDHWPTPLEDGGITFPDGDYHPESEARRMREALINIYECHDMRSELYTSDAQCAQNLADKARRAVEEQSG